MAGGRPAITLGEVVRAALPSFSQTHRLPEHHWQVLRAITACRTAALGGHLYECTHCGKEHFVPHSCRNRHCPTCQGLNGAQWMEKQAADLLPVPYFHVVFTLAHELNALIQHNQTPLYNLLFASASATLLDFGRKNLKATLGITAVLHTWGQTLCPHYHLHCIVTGGGLSTDADAWVSLRPNWLFPVAALSRVFRGKFRDGLQKLFKDQQLQLPPSQPELSNAGVLALWLRNCCTRPWVVYAKRPFAGPQAVMAYLCRYTHRVGITNSRFQALDLHHRTVTFTYKDYSQGARARSMTLACDEFLRRFCHHILPPRFVKVRHYGLLANRNRPARIAKARQLLAQAPSAPDTAKQDALPLKPAEPQPLLCPYCGQPTLKFVRVVEPQTAPATPLDDTS